MSFRAPIIVGCMFIVMGGVIYMLHKKQEASKNAPLKKVERVDGFDKPKKTTACTNKGLATEFWGAKEKVAREVTERHRAAAQIIKESVREILDPPKSNVFSSEDEELADLNKQLAPVRSFLNRFAYVV